MRRGLSQGGRWLFKKGVRRWGERGSGGKACRRTPFGSSAPLFRRSDAELPPSPSCRCLTSDVSKIPNAPVVSTTPHPASGKKSKDLGQRNSDLSPTDPQRLGDPGWTPAAGNGHPPPPPVPQECSSLGLHPRPPESFAQPKFGEIAKEGCVQ